MSTSRKVLTAVALVTVSSTLAREARADVDYQVAVGGGAMWMPRVPTMQSLSVTSLAREHAPGRISPGGSLAGLGGHFDLGLTAGDRWVIPLVGVDAYGAIGTYDSIVTSMDGSIARVRPWSAYQIDVLAPGVGYRWKRRRFMFSASVRTGASFLRMGGSVAGGTDVQLLELSATSFLVQAELEACRRLDPVTRVCLQVAPRLYDYGIMNGAVFGLRVEWGR